MVTQLTLDNFLKKAKNTVVIDVRTPLEFQQGHIPGAVNIPLFSNEDRVKVGTTYKQIGRQPAILLGFELIGSKWADFIRKAEEIAPDKKVLINCWRGGMRSGAMAWALDVYGFEVSTLKGGYKSYRQFGIRSFEEEYPFIILSGSTGSAKTLVLKEMKAAGEQVIDLEEIAQHQGSAFGSMNKMVQPSQEQFENLLAAELTKMDKTKRIWLEDESVTIGKRVIPKLIWQQMRRTKVIKVDIDKEERVDFLTKEYGSLQQEFLIEAVQRISKRLGPLESKLTIEAIRDGKMDDFVRQVLVYYDKTYFKGQKNRDQETIHTISLKKLDPFSNAGEVISLTNNIFGEDISHFKTKHLIINDENGRY